MVDEESAAPEPRQEPRCCRRPRSPSPGLGAHPVRGGRGGPSAALRVETGARTYNRGLNGHFKLRASSRRVFTRLNCSLIMRGLGRSTWEVWGWLEIYKKNQINKNPPNNPMRHPARAAGSLGAAGFFSPSKGFRCKGPPPQRSGDGCAEGLTAGRGRRVRAIRPCQPPAPPAGMSPGWWGGVQ